MIGYKPLQHFFSDRLGWWLLTPLLLLVAAAVTFYSAFPSRTLQTRLRLELNRAYGVQAQLSPPKPLFPPGLSCARLDLTVPGRIERTLPLRQLQVHPLWLSLFGSNPGLRFEAELNGGTLTGTARRNGQATLFADQVALRETLQLNGGPAIEGVLQNSRFSGLLPLQAPGERTLNLTMDQVRLTGLEGYGVAGGSLKLGQLVLKVVGQNQTLRISELTVQGGSLEGSGQGTVLLGPSPATSRLNLTLELRSGSGLDPTLGQLLELIGTAGRNGSRRLRLTGTLQQPALR